MRSTTPICCCLLISVQLLPAPQNPGRPKKILTPEQQAYQRELKQLWAERQRLRAQAKQAFDAEMGREKAGDCPSARTNYDWNMCLSREAGVTDGNYKTFAEAIRSDLGLKEPLAPGEKAGPLPPGPAGPQLTPEENLAEFDRLEAAWKPYLDAACTATFHQFGGGTGGPPAAGECRQRMVREHMRELDQIYYGPLHR